ncbi:MAG: type III-B CRISPR module-associated protein Cmr5 [Planctomycetes bacterium]|nr:type III-B CRISPR module-associated protein Cmr5 [Planctomycetota bacterium]
MAIREQERARFALAKVRERVDSPQADKFKTQLVKLPARLHTSGFGQTIAFYLSAGRGSPEESICMWLQEWLRPGNANIYQADLPLVDAITGGNPAQYRRAAAEARALAVWLKRFAEAFIEDQRGTRP